MVLLNYGGKKKIRKCISPVVVIEESSMPLTLSWTVLAWRFMVMRHRNLVLSTSGNARLKSSLFPEFGLSSSTRSSPFSRIEYG